MGNVNLHILEERENVFSDLRDFSQFCLPDISGNNRAFDLLYQIWEKASDDFWRWCYWQDYFP